MNNAKPTDFAYHLTNFFGVYLPGQRGFSSNTILSYRDAFVVFLRFCNEKHDISIDKITLAKMTKNLVEGFLEWLELEKGSGINTRNQRLSAIHSFFRYIQINLPDQMFKCQQILSIPIKKTQHQTINYLSFEGIKEIFSMPNLNTSNGRRDLCMLSLLYDTGARVSELCFAEVGHIRLDSPPTIKLFGKGNKVRFVPLMTKTTVLLREYLRENSLLGYEKQYHPLFWNKQHEKLTSAGVRYILNKYTEAARSKLSGHIPKSVSPHSLRHSKAVHLLQSGINIVYIRDILGHADLRTTEIYAKVDSISKRDALERVYQDPNPEEPPFWQTDKNLLSWLTNLKKL